MSEEIQISESNMSEEIQISEQKLVISEQKLVKELETLKIEEEKKSKSIKLISSDEEEFVVEARVAFQSEMIQNAIEDCEHDSISLPNVDAETLAKILNYCTKHTERGNLDKFDEEFLDVDQTDLYDLLMAANYLSIKTLVLKICKKVANMMKGKTPEEIREIFAIENDFAPGQEEEIRSENPWAFQ